MRVPRILTLVLAGGQGNRLDELTKTRPKPTLPIGGNYALIDVSLSNLVHSQLSDVWVIEQFQAARLNSYLVNGRAWDLDRTHGGLVVVPPFEGGEGEGFASGNADSLARQLIAMREFGPEHVLVMSADHLFRLDLLEVVDTHLSAGADLTVVTTEVRGDVSRFGVVEVRDGRVIDLAYKPEGRRDGTVLTEVFLYRAEALFAALEALLEEHDELQDYGDELLPHFLAEYLVVAHDLAGYWMDLGTLQSYWTANLQLIDGAAIQLDDPAWLLYSAAPQRMPGRVGPTADVRDSLLAGGAVVHGRVRHSVIGVGAQVAEGAVVRDCVLLEDVVVEAGVDLRNCIVDAGARVVGPAQLGGDGVVTLIDRDGQVANSVELEESPPE